MYIIVVGGGKVGYYLAKTLLNEDHEILVLEKDVKKVEHILDDMGSICLHGDGCEAAVLEEAGAERADLLIAVTDEDEDNLVACQVAKHKFNVPRTIARLNNPKNQTTFSKLGIDVTVSATDLILEHIEQEVPTHYLTHLLVLEKDGLELVEVKIPFNAGVVGKKIGEINLPPESILALIIHEGRPPRVSSPEMVIEADDRLIAVVKLESEEAFLSAFIVI